MQFSYDMGRSSCFQEFHIQNERNHIVTLFDCFKFMLLKIVSESFQPT